MARYLVIVLINDSLLVLLLQRRSVRIETCDFFVDLIVVLIDHALGNVFVVFHDPEHTGDGVGSMC